MHNKISIMDDGVENEGSRLSADIKTRDRAYWQRLDEWCAREAKGMSIKDAIACVDRGNAILEKNDE